MKKNVLALSIAAMIGGLGFAGAATAQTFQINESRTGHVLVVRYASAAHPGEIVLTAMRLGLLDGWTTARRKEA